MGLWDFSLFTDPFDTWIWLILIPCLLLVSVLSNVYFEQNQLLPKILLRVLSTLLFGCVSENAGSSRSMLFLLWTWCNFILSTYYTGSMTGTVIKPPLEDRMTSLDHLEEQDYSLVFFNQKGASNLRSSVRRMKGKVYIPKQIKAFAHFLKKDMLVRSEQNNSFSRALVDYDKTATITTWPFALWSALTASEYISRNFPDSPKRKK